MSQVNIRGVECPGVFNDFKELCHTQPSAQLFAEWLPPTVFFLTPLGGLILPQQASRPFQRVAFWETAVQNNNPGKSALPDRKRNHLVPDEVLVQSEKEMGDEAAGCRG